eukprot:3783452-Pleurochrysis_carterae.AAC.1
MRRDATVRAAVLQEGGDHRAWAEPPAVALPARVGVAPLVGVGGLRVGRVVVAWEREACGSPCCRHALHFDRVGQRAPPCAGQRVRGRPGLLGDPRRQPVGRLVAHVCARCAVLRGPVVPTAVARGARRGWPRRAGAPVKQKRALPPFSSPLGGGGDDVRGVVKVRHVDVWLFRPHNRRERAPKIQPLGEPPPHPPVECLDGGECPQAYRLLLAGHERDDGVPSARVHHVSAVALVMNAVLLPAFAGEQIA